MVRVIRSVNGLNYCPYCGEELVKEEQPVIQNEEGAVIKSNLKVECPEHGELVLG